MGQIGRRRRTFLVGRLLSKNPCLKPGAEKTGVLIPDIGHDQLVEKRDR